MAVINNGISLKEKLDLTSGNNMWEFNGIKTLKIKSVRVSDGPNGLRYVVDNGSAIDNNVLSSTCFVSEVSAANSFNPELLYKFGNAIGSECRKKNVDILLAPGVNIKRLPLCGRNFEYYSEDPFLSGILASAFINGIQDKGVGACIKHLACNNQETYRYTNNSVVDERALNEIYLYAFRLAIEKSHPMAIMTSYNKINGLYPAEDKALLDKIRNEYGFDGIFISDWGAVNDPVASLKAGLNIEMPANDFSRKLIEQAYRNGDINMELLDDNTIKIANVYKKILENREKIVEDEKDNFASDINYKLASEACVLLKNKDKVLPLKKDDDILVIGELFTNPITQGLGSAHVNYEKTTTFKKEFLKYVKHLNYCKGYSFDEHNTIILLNEALKEAQSHDKVVVFVGNPYSDSEGVDRKSLSLPQNQLDLIKGLARVNKKIIVVINNGGVVELPFVNNVKGILHTYLLGDAQERVVTETLFGTINPSGKLTESYLMSYNDYSVKNTILKSNDTSIYNDSIYVGYRYYDSFNTRVLYPFGYGLSYSNFVYQNINVVQDDEYNFKVSFNVVNKSDIDGKEVCQLYVRHKGSKNYKPYQELKGFKKVLVRGNGSENVSIVLDKHAFEYYNDLTHQFEIEEGIYEIAIGSSSRDLRLIKYLNIKGKEANLRFDRDALVSYYEHKHLEYFEFMKILGHKIEKNENSSYTYNSTINDVRKKLLGRIIYRKIKKQYLVANNFLPANMAIEMLDFVPLRMAVSLSNGAFDIELCDAIIVALNKGFLSGSRSIMKYMKGKKK